ncbi:Adenylate isopentenyltransferase 5, chloroplastic [Apostasia shenzhenica]|uniref:adenylate dimethylallyltransferase (ADP/ATP-dependent) n=1 Tax=Apostasia shenzhenica TaxID=1088818 RepID=A0A2I0BB33_9ASPA|nr:Adenylate isopentenyltransferase 5, chloroplastic [Apostasia shenzhenica]
MASLLCLNKAVFLPREPFLGFRTDPPVTDVILSVNPFFSHFPFQILTTGAPKKKAVFVLGSSGTGKSKLAIDLALRFAGEIINSDKMQVYDGLPIITNKVTDDECAGIPHHFLGGIHPDADYTASEFRRDATSAAEEIAARGRLPIIAGGSNSYIRELVAGDNGEFARRFDCCFIWVDVDWSVLDEFVADRVDRMVEQGLVEEARGLFDTAGDYSRGIRRSIGVPEMDRFFRLESVSGEAEAAAVLEEAIEEIKANTCRLTRVQREKIQRFASEDGWRLHRVDATAAVLRRKEAAAGRVWRETVLAPSVEVVRRLVGKDGILTRCSGAVAAGRKVPVTAVVGAGQSL